MPPVALSEELPSQALITKCLRVCNDLDETPFQYASTMPVTSALPLKKALGWRNT